MSNSDFLTWTRNLRAEGIELVFRMKFWAYFRSEQDFSLYEGKFRRHMLRSIRNTFAAASAGMLSACILVSFFRRFRGKSGWILQSVLAILSGLYFHGAISYDEKLEGN